ncbi:MAG: flagellar hook-length control protein FliK [Terriglobales bacterium]
MEMLPDILTGQSGLSSRSMQASAASSQTAANGQNPGDKPVDSAPAKAAAEGADAAAAKASGGAPADAVVPQPAYEAASADSSGTSSSTATAAGKTSSADQAGMQSAAKFLESTGLSLLSKTTSADGGALPNVFQGKSVSSAAANHGPSGSSSAASPSGGVHTEPAAGTTAQVQAKDAAGSNAAAVQAQTARADSSPAVKPAAAPTGDGSKNGASQNSAGKPAASGQTPGAPAAAAQGAAASAAGNAVQAAANGVPAALGQATAGGSPSSHAGNPPQGAAPQTTVGDRVAAAMDSPMNAPGNVVNAASLVETSQGRSEMRVAVQTESMGTLQLHAVLDSGRVGASISVVGHEAHTLLSNELPALQQVLTDQNLRIDHLTVINSPMSSGAGGGDAHNFQSGEFNHPQGRDARWYSPAPVAAILAADALAPADVRRRLSVRA